MGSASSISSVQLDAVKEQFLRKRAQGIPDEDMFNHMRKVLLELPREDCIVPPDLRIVTVNDVYELELLPNYATCRDRESKGAVKTIGTLPGDFLSPSLLSSLDKGKGMINCLNMAGIDYVCMGNHEGDIPIDQLYKRIRESKFTWINSNMPELPLPSDIPPLPEYTIVEVSTSAETASNPTGDVSNNISSGDGGGVGEGGEGGGGSISIASSVGPTACSCSSRARRIALLGLNTEDRSVSRPGSFGDCVIQEVNKRACELFDQLAEREAAHGGVDAVIPLTHQLISQDRSLAAMRDFPLVLGGHEHEIFNEVVDGCRIVKTGQNVKTIGIVDITWDKVDINAAPKVVVTLRPATDYPPCPLVAAAVKKHNQVLDELNKAVLCRLPDDSVHFSSANVRLQQSTVATFLCSVIRDACGAECTLVNAGAIRGKRLYASGTKVFTYADLKKELPFPTNIAVVSLPGHVISAAIAYSRAPALRHPPEAEGAYLQTDDSIVWDAASNVVTAIAGAPLEAHRFYLVAVHALLLRGLDNILPLVEHTASSADRGSLSQPEYDGVGAKELVVAYFARSLLLDIIYSIDFNKMDANADGCISRAELLEAAKSKLAPHQRKQDEQLDGNDDNDDDGSGQKGGLQIVEEDVSDIVVDNLFSIADLDGNGSINKAELLQIALTATSRLRFPVAAECEFLRAEDALELARTILGSEGEGQSHWKEDILQSSSAGIGTANDTRDGEGSGSANRGLLSGVYNGGAETSSANDAAQNENFISQKELDRIIRQALASRSEDTNAAALEGCAARVTV